MLDRSPAGDALYVLPTSSGEAQIQHLRIARALKAAGLKAPYTVGYTGTSYDVANNPNMQKVSESQAKPGDVVVFPDHIALYIGGGKCISMGQEGDPAVVTVAAEAAYDNRGIQGFYHLKGA